MLHNHGVIDYEIRRKPIINQPSSNPIGPIAQKVLHNHGVIDYEIRRKPIINQPSSNQ